MEKTDVVDSQAEWEYQNLVDIETCLDTLTRLQGFLFQNDEPSRQDLTKASGRKCVLAIRGLKHYTYERMFKVTEGGVEIVNAAEDPNTLIVAPVDSVLRVLKGVLVGDEHAFSSEWARGKARLVGSRRLHDGYVFSEIFARLARLIKRYQEV